MEWAIICALDYSCVPTYQIPPEIRTPVLLGDALEFLSLADSGLWTASCKTRDSKWRVCTTSGNQTLLKSAKRQMPLFKRQWRKWQNLCIPAPIPTHIPSPHQFYVLGEDIKLNIISRSWKSWKWKVPVIKYTLKLLDENIRIYLYKIRIREYIF